MPRLSALQPPGVSPVRTYTLIEIVSGGRQVSEAFSAPHDDVALERALEIGRGEVMELWAGSQLVRRWSRGHRPLGAESPNER